MDTQMGQRKLLVQSHLMNMFHQQHQGIATMVIQVEIQREQRYAITRTTTATGNQMKVSM